MVIEMGRPVAAVLGGMVLDEPDFQRFFDRDGIRAMRVAGIAQRVDLNFPMSGFHAAESTPDTKAERYRFCLARAASIVLDSSMAMVIGPTPPGTGVIQAARSAAAANATSPQSFPSAPRLMPTSMTMAPSRIHSPGM
jgi:hypothetical protein